MHIFVAVEADTAGSVYKKAGKVNWRTSGQACIVSTPQL